MLPPRKGLSMRKTQCIGFAILVAGLAIFAGCRQETSSPTLEPNIAAKGGGKEPEHSHGAGPHGGPLAEWGAEAYHAEFTVAHAKQEVTVFILGGDAKTLAPITADKILLTIKRPKFQVELSATPQDSDPKGKASRFVGKHANFGKEQPFAGTISGEVNGKPYAGDFKEAAHEHDKGQAKPQSRGDAESREAKVFLTPGGIYTQADIEKNGGVVPSVKFKDIYWSHDDNLMPGDRVCPVTDNKADPQCYWWVNGQKYEFCCPPCLEKFVRWAKDAPEKVKTPDAYVKR